MKLQRKEKDIENEILIWLNVQPGCFAFKINTAGWYDQKKGYFRKNLSKFILPGTCDIICCYRIPSPYNKTAFPIFIGFEIKSPRGVQSEEQENFQIALSRKASGPYYILRCVGDADIALADIRGIITESFAKA